MRLPGKKSPYHHGTAGDIDNDMFADRIIELLANQKNILDFGTNARQRCEEIFGVNAVSEKYLKLFEKN